MENFDDAHQQFKCSSPPPLTDEALFDAADGEATPAVQEHLSRCASCSARLDEIRVFETSVHAAFGRADCPSSDRLADYTLRMLSADDAAAVREHLDSCLHCRGEVDHLRVAFVLDEPLGDMPRQERANHPPPSRWTERILSLQPPSAQPALKGRERPGVRMYGSDAVSVMLLIEAVGDLLKITGTIVDSEQIGRWDGGSVELIGTSGGQPRALCLIEDDETFVLQVAPGVYAANIYVAGEYVLRIGGIELTP